MSKIRNGNDLMVFINKKSVAFATSHQLSTTLETETVLSKDSGYNGVELPKNFTWEITCEHLYIDNAYAAMYDAQVKRKYVEVVVGVAAETTVNSKEVTTEDGLTGNNEIDDASVNWSVDTSKVYYKGNALITSLSLSAGAGENSTYSVTLKGSGDLEQIGTLAYDLYDASTNITVGTSE